jgi:hypothetical protein
MIEEALKNKSRLLLDRLERISADSPWAHQASGIRASLAKSLARKSFSEDEIRELLLLGFRILEEAAAEIPEDKNNY